MWLPSSQFKTSSSNTNLHLPMFAVFSSHHFCMWKISYLLMLFHFWLTANGPTFLYSPPPPSLSFSVLLNHLICSTILGVQTCAHKHKHGCGSINKHFRQQHNEYQKAYWAECLGFPYFQANRTLMIHLSIEFSEIQVYAV